MDESEGTLREHFVRFGVIGHVDRLRSADGLVHQRGTHVICRTKRGLEAGTVLNVSPSPGSQETREANPDLDEANGAGTILRRATAEDHLLLARLEKNRMAAVHECERILAERAHSHRDLVLVDVELLFDGQTIFFYFLGYDPEQPSPELETLTRDLATAYEAKVELRRFAETLTSGCGPDCGTAEGCGDSGGCTSCALMASCRN